VSDNAATVREYLEVVWNQGRTDEAARYVAEDLAQHNPHLPDGRESLVGFIEGMRAQRPAARFDVRRLAADGDLVFVHSHFVAGPGEPGAAVVDVFRLADGRIVEHWDVATPLSSDATASGRPVI
jgi:predicted SnoaL-like aldol condensation-catalyzing enzyme